MQLWYSSNTTRTYKLNNKNTMHTHNQIRIHRCTHTHTYHSHTHTHTHTHSFYSEVATATWTPTTETKINTVQRELQPGDSLQITGQKLKIYFISNITWNEVRLDESKGPEKGGKIHRSIPPFLGSRAVSFPSNVLTITSELEENSTF